MAIKGNSKAMAYSPSLIPGNATLGYSETDLSNNADSLTLPQKRLVWGKITTGSSSQTSNFLIVLCEEAHMVVGITHLCRLHTRGGGHTHVTGGDHDYSDISQVLCCHGNICNAMLTMMTSASHYCNDISGCGGQYAEAFMLLCIYIEPKFPIWYQCT